MSSAHGPIRSETLYDRVISLLRQADHRGAKEVLIREAEILPACWLEVLRRAALHYEACFVVALIKEVTEQFKKTNDQRCNIKDQAVILACREIYEDLIHDFTARSSKSHEFHDKHLGLYRKIQRALVGITGDLASKAA